MPVRTAAKVALSLSCLLAGGGAGFCAGAQRFAISPDAVAQAMRSRGLQVQAEQVWLPGPVSASQAAPRLQIVSARKLNQSEMAVRIECEKNAVCLPFYVVLRGSDQARILALIASERADGGKLKHAAAKPCIRTGDRASLVMEKQDMRITLPVIALQSGRPGETIRVTDTDRKKQFRAEVVGPALLKGGL
jgi:hypothetical protein